MIKLKDDRTCEFCGRCFLSCPVKAISFTIGKHGNYEPCIEHENCIQCGKCVEACQQNYTVWKDPGESRYYVAEHISEDIRKKSSSGGLFTALAQFILERNGVVFGAAFDGKDSIRHYGATTYQELDRLRKSKYAQSYWTSVLPELEACKKQRRPFLFTGTPCQTATVKEWFSDYSEAYLMDLYCHGVLSAGIFRDYCQKYIPIESLDFRSAVQGDRSNFYFLLKSQKITIVEPYHKNILARLFVDSRGLKDSCLSCNHSVSKHLADITVGDFDDYSEAAALGIMAEHPSIMALNTEKGEYLFNEVKKNLHVAELKDKNKIRPYYQVHSLFTGAWGYNFETHQKFMDDYIANGFSKAAIFNYFHEGIQFWEKALELFDFPSNVFLYGTGDFAEKLLSSLPYITTAIKVQGIFVTDSSLNPPTFYGLPVYGIDTYNATVKEPLIVVASEKYEFEIKRILQ